MLLLVTASISRLLNVRQMFFELLEMFPLLMHAWNLQVLHVATLWGTSLTAVLTLKRISSKSLQGMKPLGTGSKKVTIPRTWTNPLSSKLAIHIPSRLASNVTSNNSAIPSGSRTKLLYQSLSKGYKIGHSQRSDSVDQILCMMATTSASLWRPVYVKALISFVLSAVEKLFGLTVAIISRLMGLPLAILC